MAQVTGTGPAELKALGIRLKEADPRLRRQLASNLRKTAKPVVRKVQQAVLDMPSVHGSPPGRVPLRTAIARTVTSSVSTTPSGVRLDIVSLGARMPQGEGNLPAHVNARGGWGHPVFERRGREKVWVRQHGKAGWFDGPVTEAKPQIQAQLEAALDETARKLAG